MENILSIRTIKSVFQNVGKLTNVSLQLLKINYSSRTGTGYNSRRITLVPDKRLDELLDEIAGIYLGDGKKSLDLYRDVREYDGTADALTIYALNIANPLIATEYANFLQRISTPDEETDPFQYKTAYLVTGEFRFNEKCIPIKLVSMQSPVTTLKHKFFQKKGAFEELSEKVLSLRPTIDVIAVGDTIYFLTLAGENLFNMVRSYKNVCHQRIGEIQNAAIISGMDIFKEIAESGHNPRRFVAFNENRLSALKTKKIRIAMAKQFDIPLEKSEDKLLDATVTGASEKIVKLLCNKGMVDPFEKAAVEVDGARQWK